MLSMLALLSGARPPARTRVTVSSARVSRRVWRWSAPASASARSAVRATEGIARQPEATARIQTAMIIAAALVEGVALFVAVIAFLIQGKINF